jgi:RecA-family ATPase
VSGLVAPGDSGKTTLRLTQAIEVALGRSLLGYPIYRRCKALIVSFEDDKDELHRRLDAICRHQASNHPN